MIRGSSTGHNYAESFVFKLSDFVGSEFEVSVGEPWDFCSSAGDNRLTGQVVAVKEIDGRQGLAASCSRFKQGSVEVSSVLLVPRYEKEEFQASGRVPVNVLFLKDGSAIDLAPEIFPADAKFWSWLVGTVVFASVGPVAHRTR